MALSADTYLFKAVGDSYTDVPLAASANVYKGAAVGGNGSGFGRPLQAGDPFYGFAEDPVNNTGSAGALRARLYIDGAVQLTVTGLTQASLGALVYAVDENTFTMTVGSNSPIGKVQRVVSSGVGIVALISKLQNP